jgi:hypothetical protein
MTMTALANPELADAPCSVAECFETATTMGAATVRIDPSAETPPDFQTLTLGLPLCSNHAHQLHHGCALVHNHPGL